MRRFFIICLTMLLLCCVIGASAQGKPAYTLSLKGSTVLQNTPDRGITPRVQTTCHDLIAGESPVTGLPWEGDYLPMLVQIGNYTGSAKSTNNSNVKAAGIGKRAPWGLQYADILYEVLLSKTGETRISALFSDCFAQGQPKTGVGPVRSTRSGQLLLCAEWQSGFVYSGGYFQTSASSDSITAGIYDACGAFKLGALFDVLKPNFADFKNRVKGVKAPDNLNVDITGLRSLIPSTFVSQPRPFLFADESPYESGYAPASIIHLDWGRPETISHFVYDGNQNVYVRYCGAGIKASKWAPYLFFSSATDRSEESRLQPAFANLIVQRVAYAYQDRIGFMPNMQSIGKGNADIFIGGRYIPGYWARVSVTEPTVYYDDQGNELVLSRGKIYIAQFPPESLCTFTGED